MYTALSGTLKGHYKKKERLDSRHWKGKVPVLLE